MSRLTKFAFTLPFLKTSFVVAVAVDTTRVISHANSKVPPAVFLATSTSSFSTFAENNNTHSNAIASAILAATIASPWIDVILDIQSAEKQIQWKVAPELLSVSKWQLKLTHQAVKNNNINKGQNNDCVCTEYVVARSPSRGPRIHWKKATTATTTTTRF